MSSGNATVLMERSGSRGTFAAGSLSDAQLLATFVAERDTEAFEHLVARHGPRVLRVCRKVLGCSQDAEDAFQTTFLLLANKAGAIRKGSSVGPWLHGAAHRIAVRTRV